MAKTKSILQKVNRKNHQAQYTMTFPIVLVESMGIKKGEPFFWEVINKNTFQITRINKIKKA